MDDLFKPLIGKTVETVEVSDNEVLITFVGGGEIAVTIQTSGGDYGTPYLETVVS